MMNTYEHFRNLKDNGVTFVKNKKSGKDLEVIEYKTTMPPAPNGFKNSIMCTVTL